MDMLTAAINLVFSTLGKIILIRANIYHTDHLGICNILPLPSLPLTSPCSPRSPSSYLFFLNKAALGHETSHMACHRRLLRKVGLSQERQRHVWRWGSLSILKNTSLSTCFDTPCRLSAIRTYQKRLMHCIQFIGTHYFLKSSTTKQNKK